MSDPDFADGYQRSRARIDAIDGILQELDLERERRGLAKADIARKLNLQPAAIRRLLTGPEQNPKIGRLIDLAHALDLEVVLRHKLALKNGMEARRSGSAVKQRSVGPARDTRPPSGAPRRNPHR